MTSPPPPWDSYEAFFLSQRDLIERIARGVARNNHLPAADAEDFASLVRLKVIEHDYGILRKYEGRSTLKTYLTTVIQRLFLDDRIARWGKWRSSAPARRLGPVAVSLERLIVRDGLTFDEACETLETNHGVTIGRRALAEMYGELPVRVRRHIVGEEMLENTPAAGADSDRRVVEDEHIELVARLRAALQRAVAALTHQDRLIVNLLVVDGLSVAQIARVTRLEQKPLYPRLAALFRGLRARLEDEGLTKADVLELLGRPEVGVGGVLGEE